MESLSMPQTSYNLPAYVYEPFHKSQQNKLKMLSYIFGRANWALNDTSSTIEADLNHMCRFGWFPKMLRLKEGLPLRSVESALPDDVQVLTASSTFCTCFVLIKWFVRFAPSCSLEGKARKYLCRLCTIPFARNS
jgi:hypothetical protein